MRLQPICAIALFIFCLTIGCADEGTSLKFPEDRDCGTVSVGTQPTMSNGWANFHDPRKKVGVARGTVAIPANSFVELDVDRTGAKDLGFLNALPADKVHYLTLTGAKLGATEFASLARFTALRALILTDCAIAPNTDIPSLPLAPALEMLNYSLTDDAQRRSMAAWAARCPKLEYLYDRSGPLDVATLALFRNHPSISFLTVAFGADASETIQTLSEIPKLRGLNVDVSTEAYEPFLSKLKTVELINWDGGAIGKDSLKSIGQMPALRRIRFQGDARLQSDFAEGLSNLPSIAELSLNCDRSQCSEEKLQPALCSLKQLKGWPAVYKVSARTLDEMSARKNLTEISIQGLGPDAKPEQIVKVIESNPLKSITIGGTAFTAEIAEAVSKCPTVESLSVKTEGFDGNLFRSPERLANLTHLDLSLSYKAVNLAALSRLPKLQDLSLNTDSVQLIDYGFLADCRSLTSFQTLSNFINDQAVEQIAKNRTLATLYLGQNCVATDAGLKKIADCQQLKRLAIGGNVSVDGVRQLDRIRGLTYLNVAGPFSNEDRKKLQEHFTSVIHAQFHEFVSEYGRLVIGSDGIWRSNDDENRKQTNVLEGRGFRDLMGPSLTEAIDNDLRGKVVLIDFWATWCGPCIGFMPELQRMQETFGKDRFEILGIHSQNGVEDLDDYLKNNPKPWPNIGDANGELARTFSVPHYPSIYLFDRQGKLRVAQPHRLGLESAIQKLLLE